MAAVGLCARRREGLAVVPPAQYARFFTHRVHGGRVVQGLLGVGALL